MFFLPRLALDRDGGLSVTDSPQRVRQFSDACAAFAIPFVDMTDAFLHAYDTAYLLPYGFSNSKIGTGHLNAHGHRMTAEALAEAILSIEGAGG